MLTSRRARQGALSAWRWQGGADVLYGGAGDDLLHGDGKLLENAKGGDDVLFGGDGNDRIWGDGSTDDSATSYANVGNDYLSGGAGNDTLFGDKALQTNSSVGGKDVLDGGAGDDDLIGGGGADVFVFGLNSAHDILWDFSSAEGDKIDPTAYNFRGTNSAPEFRQVGTDGYIFLSANDWIVLPEFSLSQLSTMDFLF